jgi:hypothetical protein
MDGWTDGRMDGWTDGCISDNSRTKAARELRLVLKVWYKCQDELIRFWSFYVGADLPVPSSQNVPRNPQK